MGGLSFRQPGKHGESAIDIPRIRSTGLYVRLRDRYLALLASQFYHQATCPIETPEKDSYGDIDILVEGPRYAFTVEGLAAALHAARHVYDSANPTINFAIPDTELDEASGQSVVVHRQLDVHVCKPGTIAWGNFTQSYGDMWNILGSMGRYYGLTVNDTGCHVRIPEIEAVERKRSLLLLTRDPAETLQLFGLDVDAYRRGFDTVDNMFDYIGTVRFFRHAAFENTDEKRRDRQRMANRPIFRRWVTEYLPKHTDVLVRHPELTREDILTEVLDKFDRHGEYAELMGKWEAEVAEKDLWKRVAAVIPQERDKQNLVIRGLKKKFEVVPGPTASSKDARDAGLRLRLIDLPDEVLDEEELLKWVGKNWEEVKLEERGREKKGKAERKAAREAAEHDVQSTDELKGTQTSDAGS